MAEDSGQERSEEPTEKRLRDAKRKGQVARSRELVTVALFLGGVGSLIISGFFLAQRIASVAYSSFAIRPEQLLDVNALPNHLGANVAHAFAGLIPFFSFTLLGIIVSSLILGGWLFSGEPLLPKLERISLIKGFGRMFSKKSLMELFKSTLKVVLISGTMMLAMSYFYLEVMAINRLPVSAAIVNSTRILGMAVLTLAAALFIISAIDVPFQVWDHKQKLKMTRQEVKDELKEQEGNPELKSRIRELQKEVANRRMMEGIPDADVIITNPTHYAVALKYDQKKAKAPFVIAKGVDQIALKICEIGRAHNKTVLQSPALTRAVYYSTKINQEVAQDLYLAIAQVLAYVHKLDAWKAGNLTDYPERPGEPDIPEYLQR